jgi:hypothetical protein
VWIWLAMYDLKAHVLYGNSFSEVRGAVLIPVALVIVALTIASFFLNAVFAFAIAGPRPPRVRPAFAAAKAHVKPVLAWGGVVGVLLALSTTVVTRAEKPWFALSLGIVIGLMMVSYVAVPARLIGVKPTQPRRDKLTASVLGGIIGATVCTPPYLVARVGILMLGSDALIIPGILLLTLGTTLQAGATGAVRAVKLSSKLITDERAQKARDAHPDAVAER